MKKVMSFLLTMIMAFSICVPSFAAETSAKDDSVKTIEVSMSEVLQPYATTSKSTKDLVKDFATSTGQIGIIKSPGQVVDFTKVIPSGSTIVSVTIYTPTSVKVTQSRYTTIENYVLTNITAGNSTGKVKFQRTNSPTSVSTTTLFAGQPANSKWIVQLEGKILMQHTGMDGFTVFGGSKMIIEYK